jgi:hypothetical protein
LEPKLVLQDVPELVCADRGDRHIGMLGCRR